mmetsp:Transcript_92816/g.262615  ORF Transcript_92816/g.262615 Transcript_92816/m.262615 type:complete len:93 (+) Transcript_92816:190-468(+)
MRPSGGASEGDGVAPADSTGATPGVCGVCGDLPGVWSRCGACMTTVLTTPPGEAGSRNEAWGKWLADAVAVTTVAGTRGTDLAASPGESGGL